MLLNAWQLNICMLNSCPLVDGRAVAQGISLAFAFGARLEVGRGQAEGEGFASGAGVLVGDLGEGRADGAVVALGVGAVVATGGGVSEGEAVTLGHGYRRPYGLGPDVLVAAPFLVGEDGPVALVDEPYLYSDSAPRALVQSAF